MNAEEWRAWAMRHELEVGQALEKNQLESGPRWVSGFLGELQITLCRFSRRADSALIQERENFSGSGQVSRESVKVPGKPTKNKE